jgi:hypothetical protein
MIPTSPQLLFTFPHARHCPSLCKGGTRSPSHSPISPNTSRCQDSTTCRKERAHLVLLIRPYIIVHFILSIVALSPVHPYETQDASHPSSTALVCEHRMKIQIDAQGSKLNEGRGMKRRSKPSRPICVTHTVHPALVE